jgi:hypothetical protein
MRSLGYTPETAIADLIDNSIDASATKVEVSIAWSGTPARPRIAILDDGGGMTPEGLLEAMRAGSRSPLVTRNPQNLGRFGLGLKTASFSQGRCLTVATKSAGVVTVLRWDLDHVTRTDRWELLEGAAEEVRSDVALLERVTGSGTLVLISKLDPFMAQDDEIVRRLRHHLGLVFHQYIEGRQIKISTSMVADHSTVSVVDALDPFLRSNEATTSEPVVRIEPGCTAQVFILPHRDRCTDSEWEAGGLGKDWRDQQGCYVYRNNRLLVAGGWFGLKRGWKLDPETQLARIKVEFDNTWDARWKIDVLKSRATAPAEVRTSLARLAAKARDSSAQVIVFRYRREPRREGTREGLPFEHLPLWSSASEGGGKVFGINRQHPLVRRLIAATNVANPVLSLIERAVPRTEIWSEFSRQITAGIDADPQSDLARLRNDLLGYVEYEVANGRDLESVLAEVRKFQPFCDALEVVDSVAADLRMRSAKPDATDKTNRGAV